MGGAAIIDRLLNTLTLFFDEILLVTRRPEPYTDRPVKTVRDIYEDRASLTGIHAGIKNALTDFAFVVYALFIRLLFFACLLFPRQPKV